MPQTLEERVAALENRVVTIELAQVQSEAPNEKKRGWRAFLGIHANDPHFEEAVA